MFLSKLFKSNSKKDPTFLEIFMDRLDIQTMNRLFMEADESIKISYAQTLTLMKFARIFTQGLPEAVKSLPKPFNSSWPFPHDRIFAEVVAFYLFALLRPHWNPTQEERWGDVDDEYFKDYGEVLDKTLRVADSLISDLSKGTIEPKFIESRVLAYSTLLKTRCDDWVSELQSTIVQAWIPEGGYTLSLDTTGMAMMIQGCIARMPLDDVMKSCREMFDQKVRDPKAY